MMHTGVAKVKVDSPTTNNQSASKSRPRFAVEPLGAALRVSPYDEAAERYQSGDELNAFVYSYDTAGDNESPLLVLTADDPRGKGIAGTGTFGGSTRVFKRRNVNGGTLANDASIERELSDVSVGDGPYSATVVAVSSHSNAAFVDCGVGRKRGKKYGGGVVKVLGMLRFDDMKEAAGFSLDGTDKEMDIQAGDDIEVYIKAVFPQSGRFMATLDPSVQTKKAKELKREQEADKRKERLNIKFKHGDIQSLVGNEYDGIVKAKSKAGDWYYVQPCVEGGDDESSLPVGVANFLESDGEHASYSTGDQVRVRLEGIDEKRGQLALTLLNDTA